MPEDNKNFYRLVEIMNQLRSPGGCPWDAEQTHESLKRYLLEECYEVIEAIDAGSPKMLKEELGDLLLQPVFHAAIAEERGEFTMDDVIEAVNDKLIRRHPHVFGEDVIKTSRDQVENWEKIKKAEKGEERKSVLSGVPPHLPALMKAHKVTEKAARVGFDWDDTDQIFAKVYEELNEFKEALAGGNSARMEAELGDVLFAIVNLGRFLSLDTEEALRKTVSRFTSRFSYIEKNLHKAGVSMQEASLEEMNRLWEEAKLEEHRQGKK